MDGRHDDVVRYNMLCFCASSFSRGFFSLLIVPCTRLTVQQGPSCDGVWHMCIRSHARHSWCTGWSGHTTRTVNIHTSYIYKWHSTAQPSSARCLDPVSHTHGAGTRGGEGNYAPPSTGHGRVVVRCCADVYVIHMYICTYILYTHISIHMCVYICVCVRERERNKTVCVCIYMCVCVWLVRTFVFRRRQLSHAFLTVCCCGCCCG